MRGCWLKGGFAKRKNEARQINKESTRTHNERTKTMVDFITKLSDMIDPEVMADMVSARIPKKLRVAPFAKIDDTLAGVPGDTITVPAYTYIGDAADVAEGGRGSY